MIFFFLTLTAVDCFSLSTLTTEDAHNTEIHSTIKLHRGIRLHLSVETKSKHRNASNGWRFGAQLYQSTHCFWRKGELNGEFHYFVTWKLVSDKRNASKLSRSKRMLCTICFHHFNCLVFGLHSNLLWTIESRCRCTVHQMLIDVIDSR